MTGEAPSYLKLTAAVQRGLRLAIADLETMAREPVPTMSDGTPVQFDVDGVNADLLAAAAWLRYTLTKKRNSREDDNT